MNRLFTPSSIAVYGTSSEHNETPEETACEPSTIYGCTKVYLELLGAYYKKKHGLDFRSIRYPGPFSAAKPGGGTTDYVTLMMYDAIETGKYECYLSEDTFMPMIHGEDLIQATVTFSQAKF
jgi:threonine 3-dehydrogenase